MDKNLLLKARLPERTVELDGVGPVRVRGLSRAEAQRMYELKDEDPDRVDPWVLSTAMVDPALTEDEVREWAAVSTADEITVVIAEVLKLSGFTSTALKEAVQSLSGQPGESGGVSSRGTPQDDGGADA